MPTIPINVNRLWDVWQPSQRDNYISEVRVTHWMNQFRAGAVIPPIILMSIGDDGAGLYVRTADGRHRIVAAHRLGRATIEAEDTEPAQQIKEVFSL